MSRGTEHRDQFPLAMDAVIGHGSAAKPTLQVGSAKTSSLTGLPWPPQHTLKEVSWARWPREPPTVAAEVHYRPVSAVHGSMPAEAFHRTNSFEQAKPLKDVRYLQAPYLSGALRDGAGIDFRPPTSVSTYSMSSDRQADLLKEGEFLLNSRMGETVAWTANRSLRSAPISQGPEPYLTTTNASFKSRPVADSQQHVLRSFCTSPLVPARTLSSQPPRCPTAPIEGSSSLHFTRYLGVRDSDGGRRLIEVDTTGAPAPMPYKLPTEPLPMPDAPSGIKHVPSHPLTTNMAFADAMMTETRTIDPSSTPLPRVPWPAECTLVTKHRRKTNPDLLAATAA